MCNNSTIQPVAAVVHGRSSEINAIVSSPEASGSGPVYRPTDAPIIDINGTIVIDCINNPVLNIDEESLEYSMLFLGIVSVAVFCFLTKRLNKCQFFRFRIFRDHPGLAYPVELIEETESRFLHVAAFCITTSTILKLVFGETPFGWTNIYPWLKSLVKLAVGLIYGLIYYPIFAALSSKSIIGYAWGSIYTWIVTIVFILTNLPCSEVNLGRNVVHVLSSLPVLMLSLILCGYLPYRLVYVIRFKADGTNYKDSDIPAVKHVRYLLKKRKKSNVWDQWAMASYTRKAEEIDEVNEEPPPKSFKDKAKTKAKTAFETKVYVSSPGFRYSVNVLSAVALSWLVAYVLFCELVYLVLMVDELIPKLGQVFRAVLRNAVAQGITKEVPQQQQTELISLVDLITDKTYNELVFWRRLLKGCYLTSILLALLMTSYSVLMVLRSYKRDLLLMYKGIYLFIPKGITKNPASMTVKATKFLGYQVAYAASGYIVMCMAILFLILLFATIFTIVFRYYNYDLLVKLIFRFIIPFTLIYLISKLQQALVTLCFLRKNDKGKRVLALNNRRFFHNFQFFMVYMNAAIGVISCIIMIAKSAFLGIWTIPRLDVSAFPRRYERFDSGFSSYCCMLEWDKALRNPSMVVFATIMLESVRRRNNVASRHANPSKWKATSLRHERACNRWGLLVSLLNNPRLMVDRQNSRNTRKGLVEVVEGPVRHAKNYQFTDKEGPGTVTTHDTESDVEIGSERDRLCSEQETRA